MWRADGPRAAGVAAPLAVLLAGCEGNPSVLDARGPLAARIADLWWVMFALGSAVTVIVTAILLIGLLRRRRDVPPEIEERHSRHFVLWGGLIVPLVVVFGLITYSISVGRAISPLSHPDPAVVIEVVGHQFWWEVRYPHAGVVTANELHIPTGVPVHLQLTTEDVVHSFWVPNLMGKMDMMPRRSHTLVLQADEPGSYHMQCAEFCGTQHALMMGLVVAQAPAEFEAWLAAQQAPAPEPADPVLERGREVFHSAACVYCHTIRGTNASSRLGPDLTHLASRRTLAAGVVPNTPGWLAAWILDPQAIKPGSLMPGTDIAGPDLQALLAYLASLE